MTADVNVALIGSKFMGRAHSNAWLKVGKFFTVDPLPVMHTVVGRSASDLEEFAARWGWQHASTDWQAVVQSPEITSGGEVCAATVRATASYRTAIRAQGWASGRSTTTSWSTATPDTTPKGTLA